MSAHISDGELQRRWQVTRDAMGERRFDVLILQTSVAVFDGSVRWLTGMSVDDGYTVTVIFPLEDEMTIMAHGSTGVEAPPRNAVGVKKRLLSPMLPTLLTGSLHARAAVEELAAFKHCRIGLVGPNLMSADFYRHLTLHLASAEFSDATDMVDELKAVKSDEEIECIRETCRLQDDVLEHVLAEICAGKTSAEIRAEAVRAALILGADKTNVLTMTAAGSLGMGSRESRVLADGDQILLLIETNGPSGYWGELGRVLTIGEPSAVLENQCQLALELQQQAVNMLVDGAHPGDMWDANNDLLRIHGCAEERRIYAHGMGYDMIERPAIDLLESMTVRANMHIVVHPEAVGAGARGWISDNYLVRRDGRPERLHRSEQKIHVV